MMRYMDIQHIQNIRGNGMKTDILPMILAADAESMDAILKAVIDRYLQIYPDWEISVITVEKTQNRNEQLDRMIAILNKMKQMEENAS